MVAGWVRQGLPSDPTSTQNGCILTNSERWPLMMDPQLQGVVWIKEREAKNNLQVGWGCVCREKGSGVTPLQGAAACSIVPHRCLAILLSSMMPSKSSPSTHSHGCAAALPLLHALPPPLCKVVRMGGDNMLTVMERAMEAGTSVLIENMGESIDAVLNPVITRCVLPHARMCGC